MPLYKRKKVKKSLFRKSRVHNNDDNIMQSKKSSRVSSSVIPQKDIRVLKGSQINRKKRTVFFLGVTAIVCATLILLSAILPVGVYENIVNISAASGAGKYPIEMNEEAVLNTISNDSYYFVLTDLKIIAYSNSGKVILNDMHGFANPVISVSQTRALVYDQGGKIAYIYNLGGKIHTVETKNEIITASISRSGSFAIATDSDNYTSVVDVYDKKFKKIFTWNSAKDIVNNVLINPSGNKLAVTTLNAVSNQFTSKMYILNFESADPIFTLDLDNSIAVSLLNTGKGISVVSKDSYKFVHWKKHTTSEVSVPCEINILRNSKNGLLFVCNRANDRSDNTVFLISSKGKKQNEIKINTLITDIQYSKGRIYYISDTNVEILDSEGNVLRKSNCNYGTERFAVIAPNSIATVNESEILKVEIHKGEN